MRGGQGLDSELIPSNLKHPSWRVVGGTGDSKDFSKSQENDPFGILLGERVCPRPTWNCTNWLVASRNQDFHFIDGQNGAQNKRNLLRKTRSTRRVLLEPALGGPPTAQL